MPTVRQRLHARDHAIVALLETLSRERPLDPDELRMMDNALRRLGQRLHRRRPKGRWTPQEDAELAVLNGKWARFGRPPPFQQDDAVRQLAIKLGRSCGAVHRRMDRLRKIKGLKPTISKAEARARRQAQLCKRANGHASLESGAWNMMNLPSS